MTFKIKNDGEFPVEGILEQMLEPRPLPQGMTEFHEWGDRIISGALVKGAKTEDQKFALASMIMHLGPTESHKPDAYFVHALRKGASNQIAHAYIMECKQAQKAAEEAAKALNEANKG